MTLPSGITTLAFVLHVGGGTIGLVSGTVAILARKGERLHRAAGTVFFASMLVMAVFAIYLGFAMPDQLPNVIVGLFTLYLISTAWLAVRRPEGTVGTAEKFAFAVILCLTMPFVVLSVQLATGATPFLKSKVPFEGPVLIALYTFTAISLLAVVSDLNVLIAGGISGAARIARHLWRMCLGLSMAAGSAFTNGLPRLMPPPHHVYPIYFLPQFLPLLFLAFWMVRVRMTGWYGKSSAAVEQLV